MGTRWRRFKGWVVGRKNKMKTIHLTLREGYIFFQHNCDIRIVQHVHHAGFKKLYENQIMAKIFLLL
jgi:hypothetical protein